MATKTAQTETQTETTQTETLSDLWLARKASPTGNNPCECVALVDGTGTSRWVFETGTCDAHTKGTYAQGHDAKTKAAWMSAHRAGITEILVRRTLADGTVVERTGSPWEFAELRGWGHFLTEGKENAKAMERLAKRQAAATPAS
jgi:hypothetical protein